MIFTQSYLRANRSAQAQIDDRDGARLAYEANERAMAPMLNARNVAVNEGLIPQDVYQEFDNVTVERFRSDDGDTFLNDLLPNSRAINIGKLVHKFRKASDAGKAQTSMTGQIGVKTDSVDFSYDGTIVPVQDTGFGRNWREVNAHNSEGFDALVDDQRESVGTIRRHLADSFLDGHKDKQGELIVVDGLSWSGMRNDSRVVQFNIGASGINFDFTDQSQTYTAIENAFKQVRDALWITNNCREENTYYVSREIASNFERNSSESYNSEKILNRLAQLMGVKEIKASSKLSGNELMALPLSNGLVRPIVGMAVNTIAMPRPQYNSNHDFAVWSAIGFEIRTDFNNRKCALFAQDLG